MGTFPRPERVRWRRDLTSIPTPGDTVSARWDWMCGILTDEETVALDVATRPRSTSSTPKEEDECRRILDGGGEEMS